MKKNKNNNLQQTKEFLLTSPSVLWVILILITVVFTITNNPRQSKTSYSYYIGDIANKDIKAPRNFFVEDKKATNLKKNEVKDSVKSVYDFDANLLKTITSNINAAMKIPRQLFMQAEKHDQEPDPTFAMILDTKPEFEEKL